jgi:serine/threonine protein kinase/tetratricopeptide (TPR) repeat protein
MMSAERWQRIESLFGELLAADAEERRRRLRDIGTEDAQLRTSVESLLATDGRGDDAVAQAIGDAADSLLEKYQDRLLGKTVGEYRVTAILGHGGTSTVYRGEGMASHEATLVAIKVLHQAALHPRMRSRLHSERQILGTLDHPYIAKLLGSGDLEDGTPYLMVEFVDGEPLHAYCDRRRLSLRERLELFVKVCEAVQFAHRNLVVHRDIKPANILVERTGRPKLLDFGIAKLLAPESLAHTLTVTRLQERILTPENAAPEQVLGRPITTATDIYTLGVLLYQLLTGRSPYRLTSFSQLQLERAICMDDPVRPSQMVISRLSGESEADRNRIAERRGLTPAKLRAALSGDLDAIVAMAMRKEPDRRYPSVQAFAEDVVRHLARRPVTARQGDWRYHAVKFARRNYVAVLIGLAVVAGLTTMAAITLWENHRIALARDAAAQERDRAQQVSAFLVDVFSQADPFTAQGHETTAKDLLDRGAQKIVGNVSLQPEVRAELLESIGLAYRRQGLTDSSINLLEQTVAMRRLERPIDDRRLAASLANLATALSEAGRLPSAEANLVQALALMRRRDTPDALETADILTQYGHLALDAESQPDKALKLFNEALALADEQPNFPPLQRSAILDGLASTALWVGNFKQAEGYQREVLAIFQEATTHDYPDRAVVMASLGFTLTKLGKYAEAERYLREALDIEKRVFGAADRRVADTQATFGAVYEHQGDLPRAIEATAEAASISAQSRGKSHYITGWYLEGLALLYLKSDNIAAAEPKLREAMAIYAEALPARNLYVAAAHGELGEIYLRKGETSSAESEMRTALDMTRALVGEENWRAARAQSGLGWVLIARGKFAEGEALLTAGQAALLANLGPHDEATQYATERLAAYYRAHHRDDEADKTLASIAIR